MDVLTLEVGGQTTVLHRQIVVLLFVHFFIDDILLRDAERATSATLVDLRSPSSRLDSRFQAAVTAAGSGDVCSLLVLFVRALCLDRLDGGHGSQGRHVGLESAVRSCDGRVVVSSVDYAKTSPGG